MIVWRSSMWSTCRRGWESLSSRSIPPSQTRPGPRSLIRSPGGLWTLVSLHPAHGKMPRSLVARTYVPLKDSNSLFLLSLICCLDVNPLLLSLICCIDMVFGIYLNKIVNYDKMREKSMWNLTKYCFSWYFALCQWICMKYIFSDWLDTSVKLATFHWKTSPRHINIDWETSPRHF